MSKVTVHTLSIAEREAAEILIGECVREVVRVLRKRRMTVNVRGLHESQYFQLIAIGGLFARAIEAYPKEAQDEIEKKALELAELMAREE